MLIEILVGLTGLSLICSLGSTIIGGWLFAQRMGDKAQWDKWVREEELRFQTRANEDHQARVKIMDERLDECVKRQTQAEGLLQRTKREIKKAGVDPESLEPSQTLAPQVLSDVQLPMPPPLPPQFQPQNGNGADSAPLPEQSMGIKKRGPWKRGA